MFTLNEALKIAGLKQKTDEQLDEDTVSVEEAKLSTINEARKIAGLQPLEEGLALKDVLAKVKEKTGGSSAAVKAFWVGGDSSDLRAYTEKLEKDGYDTSGAWEENKAWFKKNGITKAEYNVLVKASL